MSEWQPIETAPKDGTPIFIFQPDDHHFGYREVYTCDRSAKTVYFDDKRYAIGYWRPWGGWGNRNRSRVSPTHWMPLPEPPKNADLEADGKGT